MARAAPLAAVMILLIILVCPLRFASILRRAELALQIGQRAGPGPLGSAVRGPAEAGRDVSHGPVRVIPADPVQVTG